MHSGSKKRFCIIKYELGFTDRLDRIHRSLEFEQNMFGAAQEVVFELVQSSTQFKIDTPLGFFYFDHSDNLIWDVSWAVDNNPFSLTKRSDSDNFCEGNLMLQIVPTGFVSSMNASLLESDVAINSEFYTGANDQGGHTTRLNINEFKFEHTFSHEFALKSSRVSSRVEQNMISIIPRESRVDIGYAVTDATGLIPYDLKSFITYAIDGEEYTIWEASLIDNLQTGDYTISIPVSNNLQMHVDWNIPESMLNIDGSCDNMEVKFQLRKTPGGKYMVQTVYSQRTGSPIKVDGSRKCSNKDQKCTWTLKTTNITPGINANVDYNFVKGSNSLNAELLAGSNSLTVKADTDAHILASLKTDVQNVNVEYDSSTDSLNTYNVKITATGHFIGSADATAVATTTEMKTFDMTAKIQDVPDLEVHYWNNAHDVGFNGEQGENYIHMRTLNRTLTVNARITEDWNINGEWTDRTHDVTINSLGWTNVHKRNNNVWTSTSEHPDHYRYETRFELFEASYPHEDMSASFKYSAEIPDGTVYGGVWNVELICNQKYCLDGGVKFNATGDLTLTGAIVTDGLDIDITTCRTDLCEATMIPFHLKITPIPRILPPFYLEIGEDVRIETSECKISSMLNFHLSEMSNPMLSVIPQSLEANFCDERVNFLYISQQTGDSDPCMVKAVFDVPAISMELVVDSTYFAPYAKMVKLEHSIGHAKLTVTNAQQLQQMVPDGNTVDFGLELFDRWFAFNTELDQETLTVELTYPMHDEIDTAIITPIHAHIAFGEHAAFFIKQQRHMFTIAFESSFDVVPSVKLIFEELESGKGNINLWIDEENMRLRWTSKKTQKTINSSEANIQVRLDHPFDLSGNVAGWLLPSNANVQLTMDFEDPEHGRHRRSHYNFGDREYLMMMVFVWAPADVVGKLFGQTIRLTADVTTDWNHPPIINGTAITHRLLIDHDNKVTSNGTNTHFTLSNRLNNNDMVEFESNTVWAVDESTNLESTINVAYKAEFKTPYRIFD